MLLVSKVFGIFFALAATGLLVCTVVLIVQRDNLATELQHVLNNLTEISTASPSTTDTIDSQTNADSNKSAISNVVPWLPELPPGLTGPDKIRYRLPSHLKPIKYHIHWHPDLKKRTCDGKVSVQIEVEEETNLIVMNAKDMKINSFSIHSFTLRLRIFVKSVQLDEDRELLIIELYQVLRIGTPYAIFIDFSFAMVGVSGMYASSYSDSNHQTRWIATSKFEPTFARQAFPCFDEPDMKATFEVTVVFPSGDGYHALSNMNVDTETVVGDNTEVTFAESVPMSTYLVCFIVSDFANRSRVVRGSLENAKDFEMRVFSTATQVNKVQYALDTGAAITEYYIKYFNVPYPLPKLDMAAIPDFGSGAMEHWGLITYRETALLYDEANSSSANKQRVATVVAHELAHMWFGNLVTMKWWNDLWLNEGFASYMEYKGVDAVHPDWKMLDQFLVEDLHVVMKLDATLASHPIVNAVESPNQIAEHFDAVTYAKGASIIRMLEDLVGAEKFRNATQKYLENFIFANAETDDFLTEIEQQDFDFDIKLILKTWTEQTGFPVVEVTQNGTSFKLTQRRFFSNPEDYIDFHDESTFNYRWSIPITYFSSASNEVQRTIFNHNDQELIVDLDESVDWIKFNKDQKGYYRVNYPEQMWQTLISSLISSPNSFSVPDRAHLLSDAFALADASQLDYSIALDLSKYLEQERDYVPWKVGASRLKAIRSLLYSTDLHRDFELYVRKLLNVYQASASSNSTGDHLQNRLRVDILRTACKFGEPGALQAARSRFEMWLRQPEVRPSPDLRSVVYYYGMQTAGSEQTWDQVWKLFVAETDAQEKLKLMQALAAIKEPWILQRYINWAWDEKNVRGQDYFTCLRYISKNPIGKNLVWDYVRENWPQMSKRFGSNDVHLGRLMPGITAGFTTQTKLEEMQTFFAKYAGTAGRKQALETVKYNIRWLDQNLAKIGSWLSKQKSESTNSQLV